MTIHSEHPFLPPPEDRNQARRLRGRLSAPVSIWTSADAGRSDGWTISSMLIADGEPAEVVALVNEDADWWDMFRRTGRAVVNVLAQGQGVISDVFARMSPSPGGPMRTGEWSATEFGPRLGGAAAWIDVSLVDASPGHAGWGLLVRATIESIQLNDAVEALRHQGGRYL